MGRVQADSGGLGADLGVLLGADVNALALTPVLDALAEAVTIRTPDDSLIYANRAALARMGLRTLAELQQADPQALMADFETTDEDGQPISLRDLPSVRLLRGESPEPLLMRTVNRASGQERWVMLKATALAAEDGSVQAAVTIIEDVTEERRASLRLGFLARAGAILASSMDYEQTLRNVAGLAVPRLADWCGVDLFDGEGRREPVAVAHKDPSKLKLAERLRAYEPEELDPERGLGKLLRTGEPQLYPRITEEMLAEAAVDEEHLSLLRSVGFRSVLLVGLAVQGRVIGALTLVTAESGRGFDQADLDFAVQIADRAALAVEHARLYSERSYAARTLEQSLLPAPLPRVPGWDVAAAYEPAAEVGGDFYALWQAGEDWVLMLGDVTGKGVDAAALTALARHTAWEASQSDASPAHVLSRVDAALKHRGSLAICTAVCMRLKDAQVTIAAGGHPLPLLWKDGAPEPLGEHGSMLGALRNVRWPESTCTLAAGETLVAFTDGVTDALSGEGARFGEERLRRQLAQANGRSAEAVCSAIADSLRAFQSGEQADDIAIVALRFVGERPPLPPVDEASSALSTAGA
jgi:serine phosphatase RsbU (regulator of sigma subunit)